MAERYKFKYLPLVGKLPGKSMVEQTETAINELASVVYDNVGYVGNLAEEVQTANTNASNALDKATEALETSGRVYIKQIAAVDVNDYYDSELYYINNDGSTNIPVRDRGFLEVKTNDDKTACEQVFIADSTGTPYYRHGRITEQTLGEETTYVVTWSGWSSKPASQAYVQGELTNYLPLSGGTVTGGLTVEGTITGNLAGNADTATNATNDANGSPIAGTYLPLSGGTLTGVVNGVTPPNGDDSKKLATTAFVNAKAGNYLPLSGGTLTGAINTANATWNKLGDDASFGGHNVAGKMCIKPQPRVNTGIAFFNAADTKVGQVEVNNAFDFDKPVKEKGGFLVPTGVVQAFAGSTIPTGWLLCDGSAVSRTDYAALYAVIGTTYGAGDGSTTFNLPNLVDKFVEGSAKAGTVKNAGLPNITGSTAWAVNGTLGTYSIQETPYHRNAGALSVGTDGEAYGAIGSSGGDSKNSNVSVNIDASHSNSIYGNSTTVQPPALTMRYIIKY